MKLTTESFIEHQTAGKQEIGTETYAAAQLVVGGVCTCCEGCSTCSSCAVISSNE